MVEILEKTRRLARAWSIFVDLVRLEQTVFALPFAFAGMLLAARGLPSARTFLWVTVAMVAARTAGMALNRLIDREIDARNPRTRERALPAGRLAPAPVAWLAVVSLGVLVWAAACLNFVCLALSPVAVGLLWAYSYLKRFTWACHLGLGLVQACGPVGAWLAVTGRFELPALVLGAAIMLWVGGFDILYACQDIEVDRRQGLHSVPAWLGVEKAFWAARLAHAGMLGCLVWTGLLLDLGLPYWTGLGAIGSLLVWEHSLLAPDDLSRIQQAFFTCNALVSLTLLAGVAGDLWL